MTDQFVRNPIDEVQAVIQPLKQLIHTNRLAGSFRDGFGTAQHIP